MQSFSENAEECKVIKNTSYLPLRRFTCVTATGRYNKYADSVTLTN